MSLERVGGFQVTAAGGGEEGLLLLQEIRPDVIIVDMMMPRMDGLEFLKRVLNMSEIPGQAVIFMTAKIQAEERKSYISAGAIGVISKPFDAITLPKQVQEIVQRHRQTKE